MSNYFWNWYYAVYNMKQQENISFSFTKEVLIIALKLQRNYIHDTGPLPDFKML